MFQNLRKRTFQKYSNYTYAASKYLFQTSRVYPSVGGLEDHTLAFHYVKRSYGLTNVLLVEAELNYV